MQTARCNSNGGAKERWWRVWAGNLVQDLFFGLRLLRRNLGFTAMAVLTLALGIGVNTVGFSVAKAVLMQPLPFPDSDRLVEVTQTHRTDPGRVDSLVSMPNHDDWRKMSRSFVGLGFYRPAIFRVGESGDAFRAKGAYVTADLFSTLGMPPVIGRTMLAEDEKAGGVAVIGNQIWRQRFGSDPNVVGKTIRVNEEFMRVIGVMPDGFKFRGNTELWVPIVESTQFKHDRWFPIGLVIGRLKSGVSIAQAQAEMDGIARDLESQYPAENKDWGIRITSLHGRMISGVKPILFVLLGVVGIVLLLGCVNISNMLLSRAAARQKELAIRAALGANHWRLARQFLTEAVLIGLVGGICGFLIVLWTRGLLQTLLAPRMPSFAIVRIDYTVLLFAMCLAVLVGGLCGIGPISLVKTEKLFDMLKQEGRATAGASRSSLRGILVISEVALAATLLIPAGLALRSIYYYLHPDLEVRGDRVLTMKLVVPEAKFPVGSRLAQFAEELPTQVERLPGVESASVAMTPPLLEGGVRNQYIFEGPSRNADGPPMWVKENAVTPKFFETMGMHLLQGRVFSSSDREGTSQVCIVNETMARRCWPGENPIGKKVGRQGEGPEVIGVVRDGRSGGAGFSGEMELYRATAQYPAVDTLLVRTSADPLKLVPQLQALVHAIDKDAYGEKAQTLDKMMASDGADSVLMAQFLGFFAALAMVLAGVGIYGVVAYNVSQRTDEFGIRIALGAQKASILWLLLKWGGGLAVVGTAIGLFGAWGLSRGMAHLLYGIAATDGLTYSAVALILITISLFACWIPARRAVKVDPIAALRGQ